MKLSRTEQAVEAVNGSNEGCKTGQQNQLSWRFSCKRLPSATKGDKQLNSNGNRNTLMGVSRSTPL